MTYQEAREIVDKTPPEFNVAQPRILYFEAKAYLEAHEKAEKLVKALEESARLIVSEYCSHDKKCSSDNGECYAQFIYAALEEWRQSNGAGKP